MKLTKQQLKQIIKEELQKVNEADIFPNYKDGKLIDNAVEQKRGEEFESIKKSLIETREKIANSKMFDRLKNEALGHLDKAIFCLRFW